MWILLQKWDIAAKVGTQALDEQPEGDWNDTDNANG